MSNASSGLWKIKLHSLYYKGPLFRILVCNKYLKHYVIAGPCLLGLYRKYTKQYTDTETKIQFMKLAQEIIRLRVHCSIPEHTFMTAS